MKYELYYNDGGHGGPYHGLEEAKIRAHELLNGSRNTTAIEIRPQASPVVSGYGENHKGSEYIRKRTSVVTAINLILDMSLEERRQLFFLIKEEYCLSCAQLMEQSGECPCHAEN